MKKSWFCGGLAALVILAGCAGTPEQGGEPAPSMPSGDNSNEAMTLPIPSIGGGAEKPTADGSGGLTWDKPASWNAVRPSSNMRLAQYEVPGSGGSGELAVFYFGPGQGGDPAANARRWAGQFSQPDGSDSLALMKMEELDGGKLPLQIVSVTGTYDGGMSMGAAPPTPQQGFMLLGGIAHGPDAPWFFKLTGPRATLEENRDAFIGMLRSIRQEI
jgi:hypothetical protein